MHEKTKLLLYKSLVRTVITYAFPCWFTVSAQIVRDLSILERKILRLCVNRNYKSRFKRVSNIKIYKLSETQPLIRYSIGLFAKYVEKMKCSENPLINLFTNANNTNYYLSAITAENIPLNATNNPSMIRNPNDMYDLTDFYKN